MEPVAGSQPTSSRPDIPTSSLAKGIEVLLALVDRGSARVEDLAEQVGIPVSTVYRYVRTMRIYGLLEGEDGQYVLGPRLARFSVRRSAPHLVELARPILGRLVAETGETAILTVRVGLAAMCLDRIESPHPVRLSYELGSAWPLHAGASAKALLAYAPEEVQRRVLAGPVTRFTSRTPDAVRLRHQLAEIRATGVVVTRGEVDPAATGIALPLRRGDVAVCAVSVAGPSSRLTTARTDAVVSELRAGVRELEALVDDAPSAWPGVARP